MGNKIISYAIVLSMLMGFIPFVVTEQAQANGGNIMVSINSSQPKLYDDLAAAISDVVPSGGNVSKIEISDGIITTDDWNTIGKYLDEMHTLDITSGIKIVEDMPAGLFSGTQSSPNTRLTKVVLSNLNKLPASTFENCTALQYVELPNVIDIGDKAFYNTTSLDSILLGATVPSTYDSTFFNADDDTIVYVPETSIASYIKVDEDASSDDTSSEDTSSEDTTSEDTSSDDTTSEEPVVEKLDNQSIIVALEVLQNEFNAISEQINEVTEALEQLNNNQVEEQEEQEEIEEEVSAEQALLDALNSSMTDSNSILDTTTTDSTTAALNSLLDAQLEQTLEDLEKLIAEREAEAAAEAEALRLAKEEADRLEQIETMTAKLERLEEDSTAKEAEIVAFTLANPLSNGTSSDTSSSDTSSDTSSSDTSSDTSSTDEQLGVDDLSTWNGFAVTSSRAYVSPMVSVYTGDGDGDDDEEEEIDPDIMPTGSGEISKTIMDSSSRKAISDATVLLYYYNLYGEIRLGETQMTDENGKFLFTGLSMNDYDQYTVVITKAGYTSFVLEKINATYSPSNDEDTIVLLEVVPISYITPNTNSVSLGTTELKFTAYTVDNSQYSDVLWSVKNSDEDTPLHADTVMTSTGFLTISPDETATKIVIYVEGIGGGTSYTREYIVTDPNVTGNALNSIGPQYSYIERGTVDLQMYAYANGVQNDSVIWTIKNSNSNETVISETGLLSIGLNEVSSAITLVATAIDGSSSTEHMFSLTNPLTHIEPSDDDVTIEIGTSGFILKAYAGSTVISDVLWSIEGAESPLTSISSSGVLDLSLYDTAETLTVIATSKNGGASSVSKTYILTQPDIVIIEKMTISVTAPVLGAYPQEVYKTETGYSVKSFTWNYDYLAMDGSFANKVYYTATLVLEADSYYKFADDMRVYATDILKFDYELQDNVYGNTMGNQLTVVLTFPRTFNPNLKDQASMNFVTTFRNMTYGDSAFKVAASGGSGTGSITYTSTNEKVLKIVETTTDPIVEIVGAGTAEIVATREGDEDYKPQTVSSGQLTVDQAVLYATAQSYTIRIGDIIIYEVDVTGFQNDDKPSSLVGYVKPSVSASEFEVGIHTLVVSGGTPTSNYRFDYYNGKITVVGEEDELPSSTTPTRGILISNDTETTITLEQMYGDPLEEGTEFRTARLENRLEEDELTLYERNVIAATDGSSIVALYDMKLVWNSQNIQPTGEVQIKIEMPEDIRNNFTDIRIVYIDDDGSVTKMPSEVYYDNVLFETDHFSTYAIVAKTKGSVGSSSGSSSNNPLTGDQNSLLTYMFFIIAALSIVVIILIPEKSTVVHPAKRRK